MLPLSIEEVRNGFFILCPPVTTTTTTTMDGRKTFQMPLGAENGEALIAR